MDGRLLIDTGTLLLKSSSSEQGDLGSASDLGIQPCRGKEVLIHGAKDWPDTSRRESTGWAGEGFSTCEVVRLAGKTMGALPNLHIHLGGVHLYFFKKFLSWYSMLGGNPAFLPASRQHKGLAA